MLSIAPGSACDVCLDSFGPGDKAPCSIQCGHVFCEACLKNINRACPLCRTYFDQRTMVKLHVDLDSSSSEPESSSLTEARQIQMRIASVANEGTTEPRLRQLIADGSAFLSTQSREMFPELRISLRMIAYLCDIKAKLRSQKLELEKLSVEAAQLKDENEELRQQIETLNTLRKDEKETALAVEMSLREHCAQAQTAYAQLADRHAHVVKKLTALAKTGGLELSETHLLNAQLVNQALDMDFLNCDIAYPFNHNDEAVNSNPESLLISPLPQFTSILPGTFSDFRPLPDVGGDPETFDGQSPSCTSPDHPTSCPCVEILPFPEMLPLATSSRGRSGSFIERPDSGSEPSNDVSSIPTTPPTPDNHDIISYRNPRARSRSRVSSRSRPPSQLASRSSSPCRPVSSTQAHSRIPSPLDRDISTSVTPPAPIISRLHELMETPMSSSLPNYFPSSVTRRSHGIHSSRSPSRSRSTSLHTLPQHITPQSRGTHSNVVNSTEPVSMVKPFEPSSFGSSSGPVSSASTAAMMLEKAQREQRARQRAAEREQEKHREREQLEKEPERNRPPADVERLRGHHTVATGSHSPSQRESIKVYSNTPVQSDYSSHRGHSSRLGSSALRDSYNTHKHMTKAIPALPTAKV